MLNKWIIATCSVAALGLMSFTSTNTTHHNINKASYKDFQEVTKITWSQLGQIDFTKKKDRVYGEVMFPVINTNLKKLQGKKISAKGFIVPIDNKSYALSKNVFAQCFFCGNAGPETIMGIKFKGATPKLKTDTYVTIEGTFRYNDNNVDDWIYHIENAVITEKK
mgnify:CR=1 FL=1